MPVPVLLVPVAGGDDAPGIAQKARDVDAALAALPQARATWLTGDHDIHAQHPDEVADVLIDLLAWGSFA